MTGNYIFAWWLERWSVYQRKNNHNAKFRQRKNRGKHALVIPELNIFQFLLYIGLIFFAQFK